MALFVEQYLCTRDTMTCIISISIIGIITLIVVPFSIYCIYKFYYYRHDQGIILRYPTTLTLSSILSIFYMFIVIQYKIFDAGISHKIYLWIAPIIANPYLILIILINIFRLWLISYDINYKIIQSRATWQSLLCSTVNINDDEWYVRHRHTWGNWRWLIKILLFLWIFLSILCITPLFLSHSLSFSIYEKTADILYCTIVILLLLFAVGIWRKMPTFEDTFHILREIRILVTSSVILCIIWFSLIFWSEEGNIFNVMQIFIIFLFVFIQIFVSQFMVMQMIRKINANHPKKYNHNVILRNHTLFRIIIATDIALEQYFPHVQKEFSHENLLFFIEMMQWIYSVTDHQWEKFDIGPFSTENIEYTFAKIIPISSINSNTESDWYDKMMQLYKKYICDNAQFQINLPDAHRQEYISLIRLYQMKKDIAEGVFEPKFIKKKNTVRRDVSVSTKSNTTRKRLFTLRRKRVTQRKPAAITEEKENKLSEHMRYSKSLQAYNKKTAPSKPKEVRFARHNTEPKKTTLQNAKSADDANEFCSDTEVVKDINDEGNREKSAPQRTQLQLTNYSLTVTNVDEAKESKPVMIKTPSAPADIKIPHTGEETMELDDIYMGVIAEDTPPGDEEEEAAAVKSVTFAAVDSDRSAQTAPDTDTEHENMFTYAENADVDDETVRIHHQSAAPTLVSFVSSGSLTERDGATDIEAKQPFIDRADSTQSFDTLISKETMGNSTKSLQFDAIYTETEKAMRLSDIKEEDKSGLTPSVNGTASPVLYKNKTPESKLDEFLEDVRHHIDEEKEKKQTDTNLSYEFKAIEAKTTSFMSECEYNVRQNLSSTAKKHRRKGASGMSMLFGSGLSKAFSSIFTPRSATLQLSTFVDDEEAQNQFEIDPIVHKEMEIAKSIDVTQFVTASCYAIHQVLNLSTQSVSRFKNSKYFQTFNENVDLEQLVKEYEDKFAAV